jgi:hypothetical protein
MSLAIVLENYIKISVRIQTDSPYFLERNLIQHTEIGDLSEKNARFGK